MNKIYVGPENRLHPDHETGTKEQPESIKYLQSGKNLTGSEVILLPGNYYISGAVTVFSSKGPLVIQALNRWESFINPNQDDELLIDATGQNIHFKDLVFQDINITDRTVTHEDPDTEVATSVFFRGPGQRLDNCIIHNLKLGVGFWSEATEFVGKGNIIFNIGFYDETTARKEGTRGHNGYGQTDGIHVSRFEGNILFAGLNHGLHCYSESDGKLDNLVISNNIMFATQHRACLVGGQKPFKNLLFQGNAIYDANCSIGYNVHVQGNNIEISQNDFLDCTPIFTNLKGVILEFNNFIPKNGVAFNTMVPLEEQRFDYNDWTSEGNTAYSKWENIRVGRQVQNGGTKYQGPGDFIHIDNISEDEIFSKFRYVQAGPGLVFLMYYHSEPREFTVFNFQEALGKVKVRNVINPLVVIESLEVQMQSAYTYNNNSGMDAIIPAEFYGGNVEDLLPDPKRFGVLIFETIDQVTEPEEPQEPQEEIKELAMILATAASSLATSAQDLSKTLSEQAEIHQELVNFLKEKYKLDGVKKE